MSDLTQSYIDKDLLKRQQRMQELDRQIFVESQAVNPDEVNYNFNKEQFKQDAVNKSDFVETKKPVEPVQSTGNYEYDKKNFIENEAVNAREVLTQNPYFDNSWLTPKQDDGMLVGAAKGLLTTNISDRVMPNVLEGFKQGSIKATKELVDGINDIYKWVSGNDKPQNLSELITGEHKNGLDNLSDTLKPYTKDKPNQEPSTVREITKEITNIGSIFLPIDMGIGKIPKVAKYAKLIEGSGSTLFQKGAFSIFRNSASGAVAGMVTSPEEERVSNFVNKYGLGNTFTEYLAADPNDSAMEGRLKNSIENALFGVGIDVGVLGVKAAKPIVAKTVNGVESLFKTIKSKLFLDELKQTEPLVSKLNEPVADKVSSVIDNSVNPLQDKLDELIPKETPASDVVAPAVDHVANTKQAIIDKLKLDHPDIPEEQIIKEVDDYLKPEPLSPTTSTLPTDTINLRLADAAGVDISHNPKELITDVVDISGKKKDIIDNFPSKGSLDVAAPESVLKKEPTPFEQHIINGGSPSDLVDEFGNPFAKQYEPKDYFIPKSNLIPENEIPHEISMLTGNDTVEGFFSKLAESLKNDTKKLFTINPAGAALGFTDINNDGEVDYKDAMFGVLIGTGLYGGSKLFQQIGKRNKISDTILETQIKDEAVNILSNKQHVIDKLDGMLDVIFNKINGKEIIEGSGTELDKLNSLYKEISATKEAMLDFLDETNLTKYLYDVVKNGKEIKIPEPKVKIPVAKVQAFEQLIRDGNLEDAAKEVDFNFNHISSPQDLKDQINSLTNTISSVFKKEIENQTRGVVTNDETTSKALKLLTSTTEKNFLDQFGIAMANVNKLAKDTKNLPERILAARITMNTIHRELALLADRITNPSSMSEFMGSSLQDIAEFRKLMSLAAAVQAEVKGSQTEVARSLQQYNIMAESLKLPTGKIKEMLEGSTDIKGTIKAAQVLKSLLDKNDVVAANRLLRMASDNPTLHFINEMHRTLLLTNPATHMANILGNIGTLAVKEAESATVGLLSGGYTGFKETSLFQVMNWELIKDSWLLASNAFKTGASVIEKDSKKLDIIPDVVYGISKDNFQDSNAYNYLFKHLGPVGEFLGNAIDVVGKGLRGVTYNMLTAEDEFFKNLVLRVALNRNAWFEAYDQAVKEGLKGDSLIKRATELKIQLIDAPSETLFEKSIKDVKQSTFTENVGGIMGDVANTIQKHESLQLIVPFVKTPINIAKWTLRHIPALEAFYNKEVRLLAQGKKMLDDGSIVAANNSEIKELYARWTLAAGFMSGVYAAYKSGFITGGGDEKDMSNAQQAGWQPYSIKANGNYYSYNRFDPISSIIGLVADGTRISEMMGDDDFDKKNVMSVIGIALVKNLSSKTYLQGLAQFMDVISDPDKNALNYVESFGASFVPTIANSLRKDIDPVTRDAITFVEQLQNKLPIASKSLPIAHDILGEPTMNPKPVVANVAFPMVKTKESIDPIRTMLKDLNIDTKADLKSMRKIQHIELTSDQHSEFVRLRGEMLKPALQELIQNPDFIAMNNGPDSKVGKQAVIRKILNKTKLAAMAKMADNYPELNNAVMQYKLDALNAVPKAQREEYNNPYKEVFGSYGE